MDLGAWLRSLGLERYEGAFRENEIDETVLPSLTEEHLKELGVTAVGHRLKLLDAITALSNEAGVKAPAADAASSGPAVSPEDRAERRHVTVMFSDLVGSTALSARMDPEDLREVISAYQKCVAETVGRNQISDPPARQRMEFDHDFPTPASADGPPCRGQASNPGHATSHHLQET
jgi:hypothetical protein